METRIVYCDETGDDGLEGSSSEAFILTSVYMPSYTWQVNFNCVKALRQKLHDEYGFHIDQEMHTKNFLTDKNPYRAYEWNHEQKIAILKQYVEVICSLKLKAINVVIDKKAITTPNYNVLKNALTYTIQRIENDSKGEWNFLIISDKGRIAPMRKIARAIRAYNFVPSQFGRDASNQPIKNLIEDVLEKDSKESYFLQICDFISYFVHLYFMTHYKHKPLPSRIQNLIDESFVEKVMNMFSEKGVLNEKAGKAQYGLVIYPK